MNLGVEKKNYYRFFCGVLLTLVSTGLFFLVWTKFTEAHSLSHMQVGYFGWTMWLAVYAFLYIITARSFRGFRIGVERKANTLATQFISLFMTDAIMLLISMAMISRSHYFGDLVLCFTVLFFAQSFLVGIFIIIMINIYRKIFPALKVVEVYGDYRNDLAVKVDSLKYKYHIANQVYYRDPDLQKKIMEYDAVLINDVPAHVRNDLLKKCFGCDKRVYFVPKISDIFVKQSDRLNLFDTPLCLNRNSGITKTERAVKRTFDIILSIIGLIITGPIFAATALAIKLNDGGPVFYKQERCTIHCKKFMIIKFRSMIVNAEDDGKSHPAGEDDDRITKVGKVIRAMRIDELPQLINILKGEMSFIGPRPERVEHVEHYTAQIPEFALRSKVKGGLTGYAQVYGKYNTTALDKLKMDLVYITNYSLLLDFQIIIETLKIIFRKESTEGFTEERAAEMHDSEFSEGKNCELE